MMNSFSLPLMNNNISRSDLDKLIEYLKQDNPRLTNGPKVREFEELWSKWLGVKYSVMLNSGASANDLTIKAVKELKGVGEVIVPPLTWVSDIATVLNAGMRPVFVDIDPRSLALDPKKGLEAITPNTKAIFLTHVLGFNGLNDELINELSKRNIPLIEDVCESHGAKHKGKKVGTFGWVSNFSFYYAHHMTTIEGGMVCTDDPELYETVRLMRSHGLVRESDFQKTKTKYIEENPSLNPEFIFAYPSHNMRSTEINAILGIEQLKRLDQNINRRNENFIYFISKLNDNIFRKDFKLDEMSNYAFVLILKEANMKLRNKVESVMNENLIEFRRGLSGGGNQLRQPYLSRIQGIPNLDKFPVIEHIHNYSWYIGNFPELKTSKIDEVCNILNKIQE